VTAVRASAGAGSEGGGSGGGRMGDARSPYQQGASDEVTRARRQVRWKVVDAALDFLEEVGDGLVIEGQGAAQQRVQDHPARPELRVAAKQVTVVR